MKACDYTKPMGFTDWFRVTDAGEIVELPKDADDAEKLRENVRHYSAWGKKGRRVASGRPMGADRSGLWTANSKTRSPSWSLLAGSTCPMVNRPIEREMERLKESGSVSGKELVEAVSGKIPTKCWGCYAKGANYAYPETVLAQMRRNGWFQAAPFDEVVNTLHESIQTVGLESCDLRELRPAGKKESGQPRSRRKNPTYGECTFVPGVPPKYIRLFDSGDFSDARAVRVWRAVAEKNPNIRFWAPTSAHSLCGDERSEAEQREILDELRKLNALPNVAVRPSALAINKAAPEVAGLAPGAGVIDTPEAHDHKERNAALLKRGKAAVLTVGMCDSDGTCSPHYVCPGDCTICRKCWSKGARVAYVAHGAKPKPEELERLVRRALLDFKPERPTHKKGETPEEYEARVVHQKKKWARVAKLGERLAVDASKIGPDGDSGTPYPTRHVKLKWGKK